MSMKMTPIASAATPAIHDLSGACNEGTAEEAAIIRRTESGLTGLPSGYEVKLAAALQHMVAWTRFGKFKPQNEEDVQCFLYHALVLQFDDATRIRTKLTHGSPGVAVGEEKVGGMHFPDLIIGESDGDPDAIYIELKVRAQTRKAFHQTCLADVRKLAKHHNTHRQFFILYDCHPKVVYLSAAQCNQLREAAGKGCTVWHYPYDLNESVGKAKAAKAIATMLARGLDLKLLAKSNTRKAAETKVARAKATLAVAKAGVELSGADGTMLVRKASSSDKLTPVQAKPVNSLTQQKAAESKDSGMDGAAKAKLDAQAQGTPWR